MLNPLLKNIVKIQNGDPRAFTQMWASGGHLHRWHPHSSHPDIELQALEGLYSVQLHVDIKCKYYIISFSSWGNRSSLRQLGQCLGLTKHRTVEGWGREQRERGREILSILCAVMRFGLLSIITWEPPPHSVTLPQRH